MQRLQQFLFPALFLVVLISPFVVRMALSDGGADEPAPADSAAARRLVIVTPHNRDIRYEFERAFSDWHAERFGQPVDIDYVSPGATNDIVRLLETTYDGLKNEEGKLPPIEAVDAQTPYHMVWGGGDFVFNNEIETIPALQAMDLPESLLEETFPEPRLAGIRLYDQDDDGLHWVGVCLSSFGIVYSPYVYERLRDAYNLPLPAPKTWQDLTRPELVNRVALADPASSGSAAVAYMMVLQRAMADAEEAFFAAGKTAEDAGYREALNEGWKRGMGDLTIIAANARYFTDSASQVPADVSHANAAAGMAIDFYGRVEQENTGEDRIQFVSPRAATAVTPDPIAILYGTTGQDLETAQRFVQFLLSPEGQLLWIRKVGTPGGPVENALRRPPIRQDVYADRQGWSDPNNPFEEAGGFNQRGEWMAEFSDTRMMWQAAWIEAEGALHEAYIAILAVDDPQRRAALLEQLRDMPIDWFGVQAIRAERGQQPAEQASAWKARKRVELADMFRKHYRQVQQAAR